MPKTLELTEIQKMQFANKEQAEQELLAFLKEHEDTSIENIELLPKPESLNSVNGFITYANKEKYFFKSHIEENEQISEYYNASTLAEAGYPVITAKEITHKPGKQIVLYEIVGLPTLFDLLKIEEDKEIQDKVQGKAKEVMQEEVTQSTAHTASTNSFQTLLNAQIYLDKKVAAIYANTLQQVSAEEDSKAPINQLFFHRLTENGRLGLFYRGKSLYLDNDSLSFAALANMKWIINGVEYTDTLEQIIKRGQDLLIPEAGPAIIGHGDAHNGNIFVDIEKQKLLMFDPAFAGLHNPLLDITKPLFHNVFARWMYYPEQVAEEMQFSYEVLDNRIIIEHSFKPSIFRTQFFQSKKQNVLVPTLKFMKERGLLTDNWQHYLRAALFCCPFLTVNLLAAYKTNGTLAERYPLPIKLLGLAMSIEFGAQAHIGSSYLADMIDSIFV